MSQYRFAAPLLWLFAAVAASHPLSGSEPAAERSAQRYEIRFLQGMIDHHAMAVEMSSLCPGRAFHEELLALCSQIESSQSQEIATLQSWLADWYGLEHEPEASRQEERDLDALAATSGEEFEIRFMETMIRHHQGAIREAADCLDRAGHQELVELCEQIIAAQAAEIQQMRAWLCDWYGHCG
jgi:uncharacterized protein (DUF305 family)